MLVAAPPAEALAIYHRDGTLVAANPAMRAALSSASHGAGIRREVSLAVARAGDMPTVRRGVPGPRGEYELSASRLVAESEDDDVRVVVVLRGAEHPALAEPELTARFGLSRQECAVARLLAEGHSNQSVARTLCISPHTARHHTESILKKLNVRSRAAIPARLLAG